MGQLIWLEVKGLVRRPSWIMLVAVIAWLFFLWDGPIFYFYMSLEVASPSLAGRRIISLGEWGRALLVTVESLGGMFASVIVALLVVNSAFAEFSHREVLWATSRGGALRFIGAKALGMSSAITILVAISAGAAFFNPTIREALSLAGWQYLPFYLVGTWIRVTLWVALSMFIFSLIRSRWGSIISVVALQVAWFMTALYWGTPNLLRLIHRYFLSWSFISPFSPLGIIPGTFFLQGIMLSGLILALLGAALWVRGQSPKWAGGLKIFIPKAALILGLTIAVGAAMGTIGMIQARIAPFTVRELWAIDRVGQDQPVPVTWAVLDGLAREIPETAEIVSRFNLLFDKLDGLSREIPEIKTVLHRSGSLGDLARVLERLSYSEPRLDSHLQELKQLDSEFATLVLGIPEFGDRLTKISKTTIFDATGFVRPYIWSRDWRVIVYPGKHLAVRLPSTAPIPNWVKEQAKGQSLRRLDGVSYILLPGRIRFPGNWRWTGELAVSQSLILIHPPDSPYPRELEGVVQAFRKEVELLVERAQIWQAVSPELTVLWPKELEAGRAAGFNFIEVESPEDLLVVWSHLLMPNAAWRQLGERLLDASGIFGVSQIYLRLYLKTIVDNSWVEQSLERLRATAEGREPDVPWRRHRPSPLRSRLWGQDWGKQEAIQILDHWQQGEEMGHENYIRRLLEERN